MAMYFTHIKAFVLAHRMLSGMMFVGLCYGGFVEYGRLTSTTGETRYVMGVAQKGTIVSSITGTGQVASSNQVELKPKVSGEVLRLPIAEGGSVQVGTAIAYLDANDAQKVVRDAEVSLETAALALEKLQQPPTALELIQSQNALDRAHTAKQNAVDDLEKTYDDGFTGVANAFLDLPSVMSGLRDLLFGQSAQLGGASVNNIDFYANTAGLFDPRGQVYGADASAKYQRALTKYNKNFQDYKTLDRTASSEEVVTAIAETYDTTLALSEAVKSASNLIQFYEDEITQHNGRIPATADAQLAALNTYTGKLNTHLTDLLSMGQSVKNDKNTIIDAERTIAETTASLAKLRAGADPLDIRSSELVVTQRKNALMDAQTTLANYTVRAPFDGTLAKLSVKKGDMTGSGSAVATLIAQQKIAQIALNEVDVAKVKAGEKATLTFDAVDGLTIAGQVIAIDSIGTVSQGVVTYNVKIVFATDDDRVKSGMSVAAAIVTGIKTDVLTVPNSALKTTGGNSFVHVFAAPLLQAAGTQGVPSPIPPEQKQVEIGVANDTTTEIISGLREGDAIVTRTIAPTTATPAASATSLLGGNRGGGGFRIGG